VVATNRLAAAYPAHSFTLLGSPAAALATKAHCPIAIIRSDSNASPEGGGWIAVAVDDKSEAVLYYAMEEGRLRKAPVLAMAARWQSPADAAAQTLKQRIDSWIRRYPDVVVPLVDAHAGAAQYVEHHDVNVQLAVVGPADADFVTRLVGPHGHPILAHADCSVLLVRPWFHSRAQGVAARRRVIDLCVVRVAGPTGRVLWIAPSEITQRGGESRALRI